MEFNDDFLTSVGLKDLPQPDRGPMIRHIKETLHQRVGNRLGAKLTDAQLAEFESLMADPSQEARDRAKVWLAQNIPDYQQAVKQELEKLKTEIQASASQILAAAQKPL